MNWSGLRSGTDDDQTLVSLSCLWLVRTICQPCADAESSISEDSDDESTTATNDKATNKNEEPNNVEQPGEDEDASTDAADWSKASYAELQAECTRRKLDMGNQKQQTNRANS